jgi:hypothetical protein
LIGAECDSCAEGRFAMPGSIGWAPEIATPIKHTFVPFGKALPKAVVTKPV